ncbi:hypothetical protein [Asaia sp. HN010]|uniref:hypothetical protein n=1 Tax=Asaia sp. HN010 TaxID=3081233 RepID=UPI003017EA94
MKTLFATLGRHADLAAKVSGFLGIPPFEGLCRLVVRPDVRVVEKDHARGWIPVYRLLE